MTTRTTTQADKRWHVRPDPAETPAGEWPPLVARLLALRGVSTAAEASAYFDLKGAGHGRPQLPDLDAAVARLSQACGAGETVAVYGDFDVDGVTAAALLTEGLTDLGAKPVPYIPHRISEGYGLNTDAIDSLHALGATLLVTADCGTSSIAEIAHARGLGMDVMILDHHTVPPQLPLESIIVNPKRDAGILDEPAACGIAYYVLRALYQSMGRAADEGRLLELAALGTVCDMAPLDGENRRLVRDGLVALSNSQRPGVRALLEVAGGDPRRVDAETIAFALGPRLNAAGRLAHARLAFDLLTAREEEQAQDLAAQLDALNRERQEATETAVALAEELAAEDMDAPLLMLGHADFPLGIVGLVAARLVEAYRRPAIVYQLGPEESRASARSVKGFDVTAALRTCPELFVRFGGHRMAAGFTAKSEQLPAIKERLLAEAGERLAGRDLTPSIDIDAELPLSELRGDEIRWLGRMAPHGIGNPEPVLLSRGVRVVERRNVGKDGNHLRLKLRDGAVSWPAIAFRQEGGDIEKEMLVDIVYTLSADRLTNQGLQLRVLDLRPSA